jgi:neutral ceramidase
VTEAFQNLQPASLSIDQAVARFAVNRRQNPEAKVPELREQDALQGPIDHAVPVLSVRDPQGALKAVVFGYACHNTTLSFYHWCGDYAGFAQIELEERHPGVVAMFSMGCGADQNPLPRRTVELCQNYGRQLADAVDDVLKRPSKPLAPTLETAYELVNLNLGPELTRQELELKAGAAPSYMQRWAARLLEQMKRGEPFFRSYPYPVQVWRLGGRQWWIALGGEVVVDYSLKFKRQLGDDVWVSGYCNDVMAYIPSLRVLKEGGYEGASSMMVYGMPANRWADDVEDIITASVQKLVQKIDGGK